MTELTTVPEGQRMTELTTEQTTAPNPLPHEWMELYPY
jgi:hypothetical protein